MNKRALNLQRYGISGKRYKELCGFCEQYPEWKAELTYHKDALKSKEITDMPLPPMGVSDTTGNLAIKRKEIEDKCLLIERTAQLASNDMWEYIIKSVCYEVPLSYLTGVEGMPMSERAFYDLRRYFFFLLSQEKK